MVCVSYRHDVARFPLARAHARKYASTLYTWLAPGSERVSVSLAGVTPGVLGRRSADDRYRGHLAGYIRRYLRLPRHRHVQDGMVLAMADVAAIVTIVAFFVAAALLTRPLDRVIAHADDDGGPDADDTARELNEPHADLPSGGSA
jgi:hypothetical protein